MKENIPYVKLAHLIKDRKAFNEEERQDELNEITDDPAVTELVIKSSKSSMGSDISEFDLDAILRLTTRAISFYEYRQEVSEYLITKMNDVAPNLSALIGEVVAARLINHAGYLFLSYY